MPRRAKYKKGTDRNQSPVFRLEYEVDVPDVTLRARFIGKDKAQRHCYTNPNGADPPESFEVSGREKRKRWHQCPFPLRLDGAPLIVSRSLFRE
jgi:hypothetical protein